MARTVHPSLERGDRAPDFTRPAAIDDDFVEPSLGDLAADGEPVVVNSYTADVHPSCAVHRCSLREAEWLTFAGARVIAISTDRRYAHRAFARQNDLRFPLVEDRGGAVARAYGVLDDAGPLREVARRSVFVVDGDRTIRYAWTRSEDRGQPDLEDVRAAVEDC